MPISQTRAIELTKAYRGANEGQILSRFMGRDVLQTLLNQDGKGIRFYFGLDQGVPQLVAVSADENENDQLGEGFIIADEGVPGPPHSGQANYLNS